MRKVLLSILFLAATALTALGQHFTFNGISMMQPLKDFQTQLEAKGFKVFTDQPSWLLAEGKYLGQELSFFSADTYRSNFVSNVNAAFSFATKREAEVFKASAEKQLQAAYPLFKMERDGKMAVLNGKCGTIMMVLDAKTAFAGGDKLYPPEHTYVVSIDFDPAKTEQVLTYVPAARSYTVGGQVLNVAENSVMVTGQRFRTADQSTKRPNALSSKRLEIPSEITIDDKPYSVCGVAAEAFDHSDGLEEVSVADGVRFIGEKAFAWCPKIREVSLGEGLVALGDEAFYGCDSLGSIALPASMEHLGKGVFWNSHKLQTITVKPGSRHLTSDGQVLYSADMTTLVCMPQGFSGEYHVPQVVKHIADWGMVADSLTLVTLPDGLLSIGENAFFWDTKMRRADIPSTVKKIGRGAFVQCHSLERAVVPDGITELEPSTFFYCKQLRSVSLPQSLTNIGESAFDGCENLKELKLPHGVRLIGKSAFSGCRALESLEIPTTVTEIGEIAFGLCDKMKNIHVASGNSNYASRNGMLTSKSGRTLLAWPSGQSSHATVPEGIDTIAPYAFYGNNLKEIVLPSTLRRIGEYAFALSTEMREITVPEGVTTIGEQAFTSTFRLEAVHLPSTLVSLGKGVFNKSTTVYVPDARLPLYTFGSMKPTADYGTPPVVKGESDYVPVKNITAADLLEMLLGQVTLDKPLWNYSESELRTIIPPTLPLDNSPKEHSLKAAAPCDLVLGSNKYRLYYTRCYMSDEGKAVRQESSIDCNHEEDAVAQAIAKEAKKQKFKLLKRSKANKNIVLMLNKNTNTLLVIAVDKSWGRVLVIAGDNSSPEAKEIQEKFES